MYTLPGTGAEDAWYITAIMMEHLRCRDVPLSGGASDIYKCFDQVCRDLLKAILLAAGFPRRLLFLTSASLITLWFTILLQDILARHIDTHAASPKAAPGA